MHREDISSVIAELRLKREKLEQSYRAEVAELSTAISALEKLAGLQAPRTAGGFPVAKYSGMSIAAAAKSFLEESGVPQTTPAIWQAISMGGVQSNAKSPVTTVYSVLIKKPKMFVRVRDVWDLTSRYRAAGS